MGDVSNFKLNLINKVATGRNIKKLCEQNQITKYQLMTRLNIGDVRIINDYFSGCKLPDLESLLSISSLVKTPIGQIVIQNEKAKELLEIKIKDVLKS